MMMSKPLRVTAGSIRTHHDRGQCGDNSHRGNTNREVA